jgi:hypothetical protein
MVESGRARCGANRRCSWLLEEGTCGGESRTLMPLTNDMLLSTAPPGLALALEAAVSCPLPLEPWQEGRRPSSRQSRPLRCGAKAWFVDSGGDSSQRMACTATACRGPGYWPRIDIYVRCHIPILKSTLFLVQLECSSLLTRSLGGKFTPC